mmetsp:Transcript_23084/g.75729  ORF Transcript_23084/g.75729 Transcript_23084/m.75729 type:complete len:102 (+) Transcript_23084:2860-3165(+)
MMCLRTLCVMIEAFRVLVDACSSLTLINSPNAIVTSIVSTPAERIASSQDVASAPQNFIFVSCQYWYDHDHSCRAYEALIWPHPAAPVAEPRACCIFCRTS